MLFGKLELTTKEENRQTQLIKVSKKSETLNLKNFKLTTAARKGGP